MLRARQGNQEIQIKMSGVMMNEERISAEILKNQKDVDLTAVDAALGG